MRVLTSVGEASMIILKATASACRSPKSHTSLVSDRRHVSVNETPSTATTWRWLTKPTTPNVLIGTAAPIPDTTPSRRADSISRPMNTISTLTPDRTAFDRSLEVGSPLR